jgi:hypothetical protein
VEHEGGAERESDDLPIPLSSREIAERIREFSSRILYDEVLSVGFGFAAKIRGDATAAEVGR